MKKISVLLNNFAVQMSFDSIKKASEFLALTQRLSKKFFEKSFKQRLKKIGGYDVEYFTSSAPPKPTQGENTKTA